MWRVVKSAHQSIKRNTSSQVLFQHMQFQKITTYAIHSGKETVVYNEMLRVQGICMLLHGIYNQTPTAKY